MGELYHVLTNAKFHYQECSVDSTTGCYSRVRVRIYSRSKVETPWYYLAGFSLSERKVVMKRKESRERDSVHKGRFAVLLESMRG